MLKVGIVGAGPVSQAIHLPTLARLGGRARVTRVMDPDATVAAAVAGPSGAVASTSLDEFLAGDPLDVVVIGSPDAFHADQIVAACAAGVRGILAEKPLATSIEDAERAAEAIRRAGVAFVVGAMHTYDPAWLAASAAFADPGPHHVRSAIHIPVNARFEDMATTMVRPEPTARPAAGPAQQLRGGVLGLAIHNLPLIRRFVPELDTVSFASPVGPWGYLIAASGPSGSVELVARTGGTWRPDWTLTVWGRDTELALDFPPSYVHAGSATAILHESGRRTGWGPYPADGYQAEWEELLGLLDGAAPRYPVDALIDDLRYALRLADLTVDAAGRAEPMPRVADRPLRSRPVTAGGWTAEPATGVLGLRAVPHPTAELETAVGTMPTAFRLTTSADDPQIVWVTGAGDWPGAVAAALDAGALAVVLESAGPLDRADLARFADRPVVLVGTRTHAPQLRELAARLPALGELDLVEVLVVDGSAAPLDPAAALWDAVTMLTSAGLVIDTVPVVTLGRQTMTAEAMAGGARVHVGHVRRPGAAPRASVKVFSPQGSVEASMGDPVVALPGTVLAVGATDASLASTAYVTPRRVALGEVRAMVAGNLATPQGLLDLHAHTADLLSQVSWAGAGQATPTQLEGTNR